jgi:phosphatidylglycerol:prolipoprotein diacylglycerol transferase
MNYFDIAALGFLIGQTIGRWGNFFNQEAYGGTTSLPWGMRLYDYTAEKFLTVHPCFLYESLWCLIGFLLLHFFSKKHKRYPGQVFLLYAAWYSFGRFFIEMLRSDSLMLGSIKVSMLLSGLIFIAAVTMLIVIHIKLSEEENEKLEYDPVYSDVEKALSAEGNELDSDFESDEKTQGEGVSEDSGEPEETHAPDGGEPEGDEQDDSEDSGSEPGASQEGNDAGDTH